MADEGETTVSKDNGESAGDEKVELDTPLATFGEVFSFAETPKTKLYLFLGSISAMVAGLALPASIFFFAKIMGDISAIGEEGLGPVLDIIYALMILGVVSMVSETLKCEYGDFCIVSAHDEIGFSDERTLPFSRLFRNRR